MDRYRWAMPWVLLAVIAVVYGRTLTYGYVTFDDPQYITQNDWVAGPFRWGAVWEAATTMRAANWHPLTWWSLMCDRHIWGLHPAGFHAMNLVWHAATSVLVWRLFVLLGSSPAIAALMAMVFAIHPARVESVAWLSERKDLLCGCFFVAGLVSYLSSMQHRRAPAWGWVTWWMVLALLSKPMAVTFPCVLLLLDIWPLRRFDPLATSVDPLTTSAAANTTTDVATHATVWDLVQEKSGLFLLVLVAYVLTVMAQAAGGAVADLQSLPFVDRLANAIVSCVRYVCAVFSPMPFAVFYPRPPAGWTWPAVAACGATLVALTALAVRSPHRAVFVGWFWFLGMLLPVIGIVQVGSQAMADRYLYLPAIGLQILVLPLAEELRHCRPRLTGGLAVLLLMVLAAMTWVQVGTWYDSETLFRHSLAVAGESTTAHNNLAKALLDRSDFNAALPHVTRALELDPANHSAELNLATIYDRTNQFDQAETAYRSILRRRPADGAAAANLIWLLSRQQRWTEARTAVDHGLKHAAGHPELLIQVGQFFANTGRPAEGIPLLQRAVKVLPNSFEAWQNLGSCCAMAGQNPAAEHAFRRCVEIAPRRPEPYFSLGLLAQDRGDVQATLGHLQAALAADPKYEPARQLQQQIGGLSRGKAAR